MTDTLKTEIQALIEAEGVMLVEMTLRAQGRKKLLEVFVDTEAGITADQLAAVSRLLGDEIEKRNMISDAYTLVVSSPGLDRPLRFPWQFRRHKGREAALKYRKGDEERTVVGEITDSDEQQLTIRDGEGFLVVPHEDVLHAKIEIRL